MSCFNHVVNVRGGWQWILKRECYLFERLVSLPPDHLFYECQPPLK